MFDECGDGDFFGGGRKNKIRMILQDPFKIGLITTQQTNHAIPACSSCCSIQRLSSWR